MIYFINGVLLIVVVAMLLTFNFQVSMNTIQITVTLYVFFLSDKRGNTKSLSDAQGAVLAVHNPTKTAILHINLCSCTGIILKYFPKSHMKTVVQLGVG